MEAATMSNQPPEPWLARIPTGDERAFEQAYHAYGQRVRLMAWRICRRQDQIDDMVSEAWIRAFRERANYDATRPFPLWIAGILKNVYREMARANASANRPANVENRAGAVDDLDPESIVADAQQLDALNDCVSALGATDQRIVSLRFFEGMTLRLVAKEVSVAEATLRESRLPAIFESLRACLDKKGVPIPEIFLRTDGPGGNT
jgi:RNA polymerase sigma factor (sigma-70 family)